MDLEIFKNNGKFLMLALDHRGSLRNLLNPQNPNLVSKHQAIELKESIISATHDYFSGILLDSEFGLPAYKKFNFPQKKPYLIAAEESGYQSINGGRVTRIKHSAQQIKEMGASGVKLLIHFNPHKEIARLQIDTAKNVLNTAHESNLPFFLEIVHYDMEPAVPESIINFLNSGVRADVFKLEYPGSLQNSERVTNTLGGTPWILLTKGADFDGFCNQLENAINGGCSGFLAGRSLWQESAKMHDTAERGKFLNETVVERFKKISQIAFGSQV